MSSTPILALLDFEKPFEVEIDASMVGIGVVLIQDSRPMEYYKENLNKARQKWSTYEHKLYAVIRALRH